MKNFTVLTSVKVNTKGIKIRHLLSLQIVLSFHEKGFTIPKIIPDCKKRKMPLCLYDQILDIHFLLHIRGSFPDILPNFDLLRTLQRAFFGPLFPRI